jgi:hypothetical protein
MDSEQWRVVLVRAWIHDGQVAVVLLVGAETDWPASARRISAGSIDEACAALAGVLGELTSDPTVA